MTYARPRRARAGPMAGRAGSHQPAMRPIVVAATLLICGVLLLLGAVEGKPAGAGLAHPHILLVVADDYGWNDVG